LTVDTPGRSCPLHYRYRPDVFARAPDFQADALYVIGGLYGNGPALDAVLELAAREHATLIFNGDFNWFNVDDAAFRAINSEVLRHRALRGNVETEIAAEPDDAANGCGCAYPDSVSDADVERSNAISRQLRATAQRMPDVCAMLRALPMHAVATVAGVHVAIVHGDLESLAGWSFAARPRTSESEITVLNQIFKSQCRIIASSHTCLPLAREFATAQGPCALFNNGAAGMPNFRDTRFGVVTRIAATPCRGVMPLYGMRIGAAHVDALPLPYDHPRWLREFLAQWPPGSAAHVSYHQRIVAGPSYAQSDAYG
jgi:hypothetical protein